MNTRQYHLAIFIGFMTTSVFFDNLGLYALPIGAHQVLIMLVMYPLGACWMHKEGSKYHHQQFKQKLALLGFTPVVIWFTFSHLLYHGVTHSLVAMAFAAFYVAPAIIISFKVWFKREKY